MHTCQGGILIGAEAFSGCSLNLGKVIQMWTSNSLQCLLFLVEFFVRYTWHPLSAKDMCLTESLPDNFCARNNLFSTVGLPLVISVSLLSFFYSMYSFKCTLYHLIRTKQIKFKKHLVSLLDNKARRTISLSGDKWFYWYITRRFIIAFNRVTMNLTPLYGSQA